jgi:hypothetical protein
MKIETFVVPHRARVEITNPGTIALAKERP